MRLCSSALKKSTVQKLASLSGRCVELAVADLVVVDDRPIGREIGEAEDVVVRTAGSAMRDDQRRATGAEIAGDPVPGLIVAVGREAFAGRPDNIISCDHLRGILGREF